MTGRTLELTARRKPTTNPRFQYGSGMIRSKKTFKYGYFEARLKVPAGVGVWPAFWLNPDADANGQTTWPPEIDILEFVHNGKEEKANMNHIAVHSRPKDGEPDRAETAIVSRDGRFKPEGKGHGYYHAPFNFPDDYHVFGCLWNDDDTVAVFVDGKPVVKFRYKWVHADGREAPNAHVLLNLSIGGKWAGRHGIDDSAFPQALSVDYVRVYQKEGRERVGQSAIGRDLLKPTTGATR
jgi:beta-glucanase (GH16 family)